MHSQETKQKIANTLKGHKHSEETKQKIREARKKQIFSKETKNKLALAIIKRFKNKTYEEIYGVEKAKEIKKGFRLRRIKEIELNNGQARIGKNEKQLLDEQEIKDNCIIIRQYIVSFGDHFYIADGYCKETNTVYEVYEKIHKKQIFEDLERENEICKKLNCDFIIIWDN